MRSLQWASLALSALLALASADSNASDAAQSRQMLPSTFKPPQHFRNVNLVRHINLEKSYPKETINVVIETIDAQPQSEYYIPFEQGTLARVGGLEVRDKKDAETPPFAVDVVGIDPYSATEYYKVTLPSPLPSKEQLTLAVTYHTLSALTPLPAQIQQNDKQYVQYRFSAYAPSAYVTLKQKTNLKMPSADVPDYTIMASKNAEGKEDPQMQGTKFTYGPYGEIEAGAVQEVALRYEFTKPLTHATLLERDVEVSHWGGNLASEERFWLTNRAATLKNHFSRVAYQQSSYYNPPTSALKELRFPLPVGSMDPYFTDDIGNVSTSRFRSNMREANLELKPRYPVFGGWNYSFKVGWDAALKNFLKKTQSGDGYVLNVPFLEGPKQAEGIEYEKVILRVILPEGAR